MFIEFPVTLELIDTDLAESGLPRSECVSATVKTVQYVRVDDIRSFRPEIDEDTNKLTGGCIVDTYDSSFSTEMHIDKLKEILNGHIVVWTNS